MTLKEYLTESALQEEKTLPEAKNNVIFSKIFIAFINGDTSITLPSKINKSTKLYQCPHSDTCVNGSKIRGICKIGLSFGKKCKAYDERTSYYETLY
jgi:hypothetical protein